MYSKNKTKTKKERRKLFDLRLLTYMEYLFIINDIFDQYI